MTIDQTAIVNLIGRQTDLFIQMFGNLEDISHGDTISFRIYQSINQSSLDLIGKRTDQSNKSFDVAGAMLESHKKQKQQIQSLHYLLIIS